MARFASGPRCRRVMNHPCTACVFAVVQACVHDARGRTSRERETEHPAVFACIRYHTLDSRSEPHPPCTLLLTKCWHRLHPCRRSSTRCFPLPMSIHAGLHWDAFCSTWRSTLMMCKTSTHDLSRASCTQPHRAQHTAPSHRTLIHHPTPHHHQCRPAGVWTWSVRRTVSRENSR
jgi:hypothetical protein